MWTKIAIFGAAGTVGSCTAFAIATGGLAQELVLYDVNAKLLESHSMDLQSASANISDIDIRATEMEEDLGGAEIVIVAAGSPWRKINSRMELLSANHPVLEDVGQKIQRHCSNAILITVVNPIDPLNLELWKLTGGHRERCLGYALNDTIRFRNAVARVLGCSPATVDGIVIGEHGDHGVPLFSSIRVNNQPIEIGPELRETIRSEVSRALLDFERLGTGRTTGWTSAVGIASMIRAMMNDTGEVFPCSFVLDGEYDRRGFSATLPVRLGRNGIQELINPAIDEEENQALESCFDFLNGLARASL